MSQASSRPPSIASLATALAAPDPTQSVARHRIKVARLPPQERLLFSIIMVMLPVVAAGLGYMGWEVDRLVVAMREDMREDERRGREALPAEAVLLNEQAWRREAAARPLATPNLLLARCRLLAGEKRWTEVEASVVAVAQVDPGSVLPATRLLRAEALLGLGRQAEAGEQLHGIDASLLDEAGRSRLADLGAQVWSASGPERAASALRPAEQPDQAPAQ